jgi:hypothetical protein
MILLLISSRYAIRGLPLAAFRQVAGGGLRKLGMQPDAADFHKKRMNPRPFNVMWF